MSLKEGDVVGLWRVLDDAGKNSRGQRIWVVECQGCGFQAVRPEFKLTLGYSGGCTRCCRVDIRLPGSLPPRERCRPLYAPSPACSSPPALQTASTSKEPAAGEESTPTTKKAATTSKGTP